MICHCWDYQGCSTIQPQHFFISSKKCSGQHNQVLSGTHKFLVACKVFDVSICLSIFPWTWNSAIILVFYSFDNRALLALIKHEGISLIKFYTHFTSYTVSLIFLLLKRIMCYISIPVMVFSRRFPLACFCLSLICLYRPFLQCIIEDI